MTERTMKKRQAASIRAVEQLIKAIREIPQSNMDQLLWAIANEKSWKQTYVYCKPVEKLLLRGIRDLIRRAHKGIDIKL